MRPTQSAILRLLIQLIVLDAECAAIRVDLAPDDNYMSMRHMIYRAASTVGVSVRVTKLRGQQSMLITVE